MTNDTIGQVKHELISAAFNTSAAAGWEEWFHLLIDRTIAGDRSAELIDALKSCVYGWVDAASAALLGVETGSVPGDVTEWGHLGPDERSAA